MSRPLTFVLVGLFGLMAALWVVACTSSAPSGSGSTCVPGQTVSCACPGNVTGVQTCALGGKSFGVCACGASAGSSSGSSASGSMATSGGQSASGSTAGTGSPGATGSSGASGEGAASGSATAASIYQCFASAGPIGISPAVDAGAPGSCGASDFTVPCGKGTCPRNSTCSGGTGCQCNPGFQTEDCSGHACASSCTYPNYGCAPFHTCSFATNYDPTGTTAEMLFAYGSGGTFVALRIQPALLLQGTYQPVAWAGANPFVTPAGASANGPYTGNIAAPVDWNNGAVGPGNIAIWVMVVNGSSVTHYVSRPGGAPVQISGAGINFMPGPDAQGFSVSFHDESDAGSGGDDGGAGGDDAGGGGADLEALMPDGTPDPSQPVFVAADTTVRVVGANSATAQCGGGGATCTSFSNCQPNGGLKGDGCRSDSCPYSMCGAQDPSTGKPVCCTLLGGSCSDSSECCDGDACTDGVCQESTTPPLCGQDAGPAAGGGDGGSFAWCCCNSIPAIDSCNCSVVGPSPPTAADTASCTSYCANNGATSVTSCPQTCCGVVQNVCSCYTYNCAQNLATGVTASSCSVSGPGP